VPKAGEELAEATAPAARLVARTETFVKGLVAPLVASLLLSACGGGSKTTGQTSTASTATTTKTIVVEEREFRVIPSTSRFKLGTYKFKGVNKGTIPHVLELEGPGLENETDTIQPGESYTIELTLHEPASTSSTARSITTKRRAWSRSSSSRDESGRATLGDLGLLLNPLIRARRRPQARR
jgi:hypothetical protein